MSKSVSFKPINPSEPTDFDVSPRLRLWSVGANGILIASASGVILSILATYIHRPWLGLMNALHEMISAHMTLGLLLVLGVISVALGGVGLYTIRKRSSLILGLQIFALIFLAVLEVGALYGFLTHWLTNLTLGVTYAVQSFRPGQMDPASIAAIQSILHCCGRSSYEDYFIANEDIPMNYVPFSCCDIYKHGSETCHNASLTTMKGRVGKAPEYGVDTNQLIIPKHMAFDRGCQSSLYTTVLPLLLILFGALLFFNLLTAISNGVYLHYSSQAEMDSIEFVDAALRGECQ
ncbi:unnamed protein product [Echinostoma caproni]|uniref:Tetraspanin n=1 Tax=Echinostoma caproni TaxID=27848 RepID=A0A183A674_9TREM|nr:unnamed protein product [Echinostoma caproni]